MTETKPRRPRKKPAPRVPVDADLMDLARTSAKLGTSEKATRAMIARHYLPALKLGGRVYVRRSTLEKFLDRKEREFMSSGPEAT